MTRDRRIRAFLASTCWALEPQTAARLAQIVQNHYTAAGRERPDAIDVEIATTRAQRIERAEGLELEPEPTTVGSARLIPIQGVIAPRASMVNDISQPRGTSVEGIREAIHSALEDATVRSIVLAIDSPGGAVDGVSELAETIRAARERKPILAVAHYNVLSAAFWIAAQATKVYATNGSRMGSIGIVQISLDDREAMKSRGVDVQVLTSGEKKGVSPSDKRFSVAQLESLARDLQDYHDLFVRDVAAGRGIDESVAAAWADGDVLIGAAAVSKGLADGISSLESVLAEAGDTMARPKTAAGKPAPAPKGRAASATRAQATTTDTDPDARAEDDPDEEDEEEEPGDEAAAPAVTVQVQPAAKAGGKRRTEAQIEQDSIRAERERTKQIRALGSRGQEELVEQLVEQGATVQEATEQLFHDLRERRAQDKPGRAARAELRPTTSFIDDAPAPAPIDARASAAGRVRSEFLAACRRAWDQSQLIQAEFGEFDLFVAFEEGVACRAIKGRSQMLAGGRR